MEQTLRAKVKICFKSRNLKKMLLIKNDGHISRVYIRQKKLGWLSSFIISCRLVKILTHINIGPNVRISLNPQWGGTIFEWSLLFSCIYIFTLGISPNLTLGIRQKKLVKMQVHEKGMKIHIVFQIIIDQ